ncbi:hypothetical protein J6590_005541 [Homalodisca vitripennis]|nr:hypothetical protein J6590_005541 [Homalodisca vitripennis]
MNQLNVKCKQISDLETELSSRNRDLEAAENRVQTLNCSFREKSVECNLLEDESTEIIMGLKQQKKVFLTIIEVLEAELVCLRAQIAGLEARVNYSVGTLTPSPATPSETPLMDLGVGPNDLCGGDASDIGYKALFDLNSQLEIMCHNFGVTFVEANCWVARRDLGRDSRHLNRRGVARLAALFEAVMDFGLRLETEHSAAVYPLSSISNSQTPPIPGNGQ